MNLRAKADPWNPSPAQSCLGKAVAAILCTILHQPQVPPISNHRIYAITKIRKDRIFFFLLLNDLELGYRLCHCFTTHVLSTGLECSHNRSIGSHWSLTLNTSETQSQWLGLPSIPISTFSIYVLLYSHKKVTRLAWETGSWLNWEGMDMTTVLNKLLCQNCVTTSEGSLQIQV